MTLSTLAVPILTSEEIQFLGLAATLAAAIVFGMRPPTMLVAATACLAIIVAQF